MPCCRARNIAGDLRCGGILVTISTSAMLFMVRATYMWFVATQQQNRDHSSMQIPKKNTRFRFLLKQDFPLNGRYICCCPCIKLPRRNIPMHRAAKVQAHHHSCVQRLYLSLLGVVWGRHKPVGAAYIVVATKIRTYPSRKFCSVGRVCVWTTSWCLYTSTVATIPPLHWHIWCDLWWAPPTPAMKLSPKRYYM